MSRHDDLIVSLFRLVHIARSAHTKRALTTVDPDPTLNFWRLFHGNQLDSAVLEWCKVFGSDAEPTHWKNVIPAAEHDSFRAGMLADLGINAEQWAAYWEEMKAYRDSLVAHHFEVPGIDKYPHLDLVLRSAYFYYHPRAQPTPTRARRGASLTTAQRPRVAANVELAEAGVSDQVKTA